ncbi:MAG TPA: hypothetical protein VK968_01925, partial [Roseimicrobium sp.]|nr:hypothetical protein [Roseimicrobium sp.]
MTREETFGVWAPPMTAWSDWVKPVLFAHINPNRAVAAVVPTDPALMSWLPSPDGTCVLVIDLPAEAGLSAVAAAALRGYRPVPLYNALPVPAGRPKDSAVCDMTPHLDGITDLTGLLQTLTLPPDAPPAFLLDSLRSVATG